MKRLAAGFLGLAAFLFGLSAVFVADDPTTGFAAAADAYAAMGILMGAFALFAMLIALAAEE